MFEKIKVFVVVVPWPRSFVSMYLLQRGVGSSKVHGQLSYLAFRCGEGVVNFLGGLLQSVLSLFLSRAASLTGSR